MSATLKKLLTVTLVGVACAVLIGWARGLFSTETLKDAYRVLSDGFFVSGGVLLAWGALVWASNGGVFDGLTFTAKNMIGRIRRDFEDSKLSFSEYQEQRQAKASSPKVPLLSGAILMAVAIVFLLLYSYV